MSHPLIDRLTQEMGWPELANEHDVHEFTSRPGIHCIFVPGDFKRNLESADMAVILPELKMVFQGRFDCAVVADSVEYQVREAAKILKTPSIIFYREGEMIGGLPKVRDWDEYVVRINQILAAPVAAPTE